MTDAPALSRLPDLIALAEEDSSEKRRALLRELTEHFFGGSSRTPTEDKLYDAVLVKLADDMESAVRAELSARFANAPDAPHTLIRRLANDEAAVAGAVLAASPVLTDEDLLGVVRRHGQDHLRAVSARPSVSEAVSEVIVERGDDETLGTLLRNDGARLSRKASEAAVERAKVNPDLRETVASCRAGLTLARSMAASDALRDRRAPSLRSRVPRVSSSPRSTMTSDTASETEVRAETARR